MANLAKLKDGVEPWNRWRKQNPEARLDLREADLRGAYLYGADLRRANLVAADLGKAYLSAADLANAHLIGADLHMADVSRASLIEADLSRASLCRAVLHEADLRRASLIEANLQWAGLSEANLSGADLRMAFLRNANLSGADLSGADLSEADLTEATFVNTNLEGANLTDCSVYGISAWNVRLEGAIQSNLVITPFGESLIEVDNLEVAQFIYLLLNNKKLRSVIDTITSKVVLILGRFTPHRKVVLDAIREEIRRRDYLPVLFDFEKPSGQTTVETVFHPRPYGSIRDSGSHGHDRNSPVWNSFSLFLWKIFRFRLDS